MIRAVADTHAAIWFLQSSDRLSNAAARVLDEAVADGDQIAISAMSIVEIIYLSERGRIAPTALADLAAALDSQGATLVVIPMGRVIAEQLQAISRTSVPELPDRVIAATALNLGVPLITSDLHIRASGIATVW